jgi:ATP-dependent Clp protease protease subunit
MKNWYSIKNVSDSVINISIHDEIGLWGVNASDFIKDLRANQSAKSINLSIHSPGGSVLDGLAMYNALVSHPAKIYAHVEGIAASAASFILMAADQITMPEDAFIMIHNAHGGAMGDANDLRDVADVIEKLQDSIINIYEKRTGKNREDLAEMMNAETWMNANESLEHGFIDTISDSIGVAAKVDSFDRHFKNMPVNKTHDFTDIKNERDLEKRLRDSGLSKKQATGLASQAKKVFQSDSGEYDLAKIGDRLNKIKLTK